METMKDYTVTYWHKNYPHCSGGVEHFTTEEAMMAFANDLQKNSSLVVITHTQVW